MPVPAVRSRYLDPETLQRVSGLELYARELVEGLRVGRHRSRLRGASTDFALHRQYVQGDEIKHIDWRVWGRTSRYYLKLYQAETDLTAQLLLDASSSMHYGSGEWSKLEYAKHLAACLAYIVVHQHDGVGLGVFDDRLRLQIPAKASTAVVRSMAQELEHIDPVPRTDVFGILQEYAQRLKRRSTVVLFSDLFDGTDAFLRGLEHLRMRGHGVMVYHLLDPDELEFPFKGTCRFEGLEGEEPLILQTQQIREAYLAEVERFTEDIRQHCRVHCIDYQLVDTSRPVAEVLVEALTRPGR